MDKHIVLIDNDGEIEFFKDKEELTKYIQKCITQNEVGSDWFTDDTRYFYSRTGEEFKVRIKTETTVDVLEVELPKSN